MENKNKNKRRKSINVRLDDDNYQALNDLKAISGYKTWEDFFVHFINNGRGFQKVYVDKGGVSLKLINHLIKQGNNLNQLAKIANENGKVSDEDAKKIHGFFREVLKVKSTFVKRVKQVGSK
tara:strand:- start:4525 stop:4890 length:366 start_codon:yes stop_codon:yes gene_type:complete